MYNLNHAEFIKYINSTPGLANNDFIKLFANISELQYNIIMRILKRTNISDTNYFTQPYADFLNNVSTLDNDGFVNLFKLLAVFYSEATNDVLELNKERLEYFNKIGIAQREYKTKFKDGKIKIEDNNQEEDEHDDECKSDDEDNKVKTLKTSKKTKSKDKKVDESVKDTAGVEEVVKKVKSKKTEPVPEPIVTEPIVTESKEEVVKKVKSKKAEPIPEPIVTESKEEVVKKVKGKKAAPVQEQEPEPVPVPEPVLATESGKKVKSKKK